MDWLDCIRAKMQLPYFETSHLRLIVFIAAFAIWGIPESLASFSQHSRSGSTRRDRGSYLILMVTLYLGLFTAFILAFRLPAAGLHVDLTQFFYLGILLILAGIALRWYAILTLGRFFTRDVATQTGQTIVRRGPYHWIRHPAYTGSLITLLGVGLALTNWASLVALLALNLAGFLYRISVEESALLEAFGQTYREYMRSTRRLIPFIL